MILDIFLFRWKKNVLQGWLENQWTRSWQELLIYYPTNDFWSPSDKSNPSCRNTLSSWLSKYSPRWVSCLSGCCIKWKMTSQHLLKPQNSTQTLPHQPVSLHLWRSHSLHAVGLQLLGMPNPRGLFQKFFSFRTWNLACLLASDLAWEANPALAKLTFSRSLRVVQQPPPPAPRQYYELFPPGYDASWAFRFRGTCEDWTLVGRWCRASGERRLLSSMGTFKTSSS